MNLSARQGCAVAPLTFAQLQESGLPPRIPSPEPLEGSFSEKSPRSVVRQASSPCEKVEKRKIDGSRSSHRPHTDKTSQGSAPNVLKRTPIRGRQIGSFLQHTTVSLQCSAYDPLRLGRTEEP